LRNNFGSFFVGFLGYILDLDDILFVEFSVVYHGLIMVKDLGYVDLVCYIGSLVCINLINGPFESYYVYTILIQDKRFAPLK